MGNSLALYNPPIRVAEEFAMLDCISGGRLVAGFPVGTPMDTCYAYGQNPSQLRERYHEAHDLILQAWHEPTSRSRGTAAINQLRYVNVVAAPGAEAAPADLDPGRRLDRDLALVRASATTSTPTSRTSATSSASATMNGFWEEMERLGKDRNPYRAGFLQFVGVAESREEALELYREPAEYFYGRCLHVDARFATAARLHERGDDARARAVAGGARGARSRARAARAAAARASRRSSRRAT